MIKTKQGAKAYEHSMSHALEFFSKAGSLYTKGKSFYEGNKTAKELFINSWIADKPLSLKLLFWLRDCRGGAGNRSGARECFRWLAENDPEWLRPNLSWIVTTGRWDDLRSLYITALQDDAEAMWIDALKQENVLAAKWAKLDGRDVGIRKELGMSNKAFRKFIADMRKGHIVEYKMCENLWNQITYKSVPSVAMARYNKAFAKHDEDRFAAYKAKLVSGEETIHASVLFPHDCVRTVLHGDGAIANAQFEAMPNYLEGVNGDEKIIVISDTSGSMSQTIGGSVQAMHVSQGLALYCSSRMPKDSPFYKRFIGFCDESRFKDWRDKTFSQAVNDHTIFDGAIGSTQIDKALNLILNTALKRNIEQVLMPTTLLIVSDMQFAEGATDGGMWDSSKSSRKDQRTVLTEIEKVMLKFDEVGYMRPKIVYWNTAGYEGSQGTLNQPNTGLVSGFSPSICKAIFGGDDFSPIAIMMRAIEKYAELRIPLQSAGTEG